MKKRLRTLSRAAFVLSCLGMLVPQAAFAAGPEKTEIIDVALRDGGVLVGQIFSAEGAPTSGAEVKIVQNGKELVRTTTDENGLYAVRGLQGGMYHVVVGETVGAYRVWTTGTAPPSAIQGALLVEGQGTVRGQLGSFLTQPWVLAAIIATAIAVPIAVSNNSSSS